MIVEKTLTRTILIIAVFTSISGNTMYEEPTTTTESSSEYLRKVMLELQGMNLPPSPVTVHSTGSTYFDVDDRHFLTGKRYSNEKRIIQQVSEQQDNSGIQAKPILQRSKAKKIEPVALDQMISESATHNHYYQVPGSVMMPSGPQKAPEVSALTNIDLATMYKHGIGKGSAVSLNALANVLRHRQLPSVTNQVELIPVPASAPAQPVYSYLFYPMESFINDKRHQGPFQAMQSLKPVNTQMAQESQKDIGNPLFMAISGFVGMAVLFMIGVILFPRLGGFNSRFSNESDFLDLTKKIGEAIDQNCNDRLGKECNKSIVVTQEPLKIARPSSVVLLTSKSSRQKDVKRRRKVQKNCKFVPCKKNEQRVAPT